MEKVIKMNNKLKDELLENDINLILENLSISSNDKINPNTILSIIDFAIYVTIIHIIDFLIICTQCIV